MVTFTVSDVRPAEGPLAGVDERRAVEMLAGGPVEAWSRPRWPLAAAFGSRPRLVGGQFVEERVAYHPFVAAVHAAFDQHRPLELSPDAVWLCIAQGFATHVQLNAGALRADFVAHQGRETLALRRDDFIKNSPDNPWPEVFSSFSSQILERAGAFHGLLVADFSTTDAISRAASEITLLGAAQPYFRCELTSCCGIPEITLTGTLDDWQSVRRRAFALARYRAADWVAALVPVLDRVCESFEGRADRGFWGSFYKQKNASGGPYITGWVNTLLPYVLDLDGKPQVNHATARWAEGLASPLGGGPTTEQLPSGLARAPFLWKYLTSEHRMEFLGGFCGVGQDPKTLALRPEIGWAVRELPR